VDSAEQGESPESPRKRKVVCVGKKQMRIGKEQERRFEREVKGHTLMVDSASEAYVALNGLGVDAGSEEPCFMELGGIEGGKPVQIDKKGKITVRIGKRKIILKDVLIAPHTEIGTGQGEVNEPALLIGLRKFARDTGISTTFLGDGETVEMADEKGLIARYKASPGDMYIINQNSAGSSERAPIRAFPVSAQDTESDVVLGGREIEKAVIKLECAGMVQDTARNTEGNKDYSLRAHDPSSASSSTPPSPSSPDSDAMPNPAKTDSLAMPFLSCDCKCTESKKSERKTERKGVPKARKSKMSAQELGVLIHRRMHIGKTASVHRVLKKAFGDDYEPFEGPCDACMLAQARMLTRCKSARRKQTTRGACLHYDIFTFHCRTTEKEKYALIVVDEATSLVWVIGLQTKGQAYEAMKSLILQIERKVRSKVEEIVTGEDNGDVLVSSLRCDNAGENLSKAMRDLCSIGQASPSRPLLLTNSGRTAGQNAWEVLSCEVQLPCAWAGAFQKQTGWCVLKTWHTSTTESRRLRHLRPMFSKHPGRSGSKRLSHMTTSLGTFEW